MTDTRRAVIAGATGTMGRCLARHLAREGWEVTGLSRHAVEIPGVQWLGVDLADAQACRQVLGGRGFTHVFYAARARHVSGQPEPVDANAAMLANVVTAVESDRLEHVHVVHGTKHYGSHLGPFKTPAREDDPRLPVPNFYYVQQDWLDARQRERGWTWSISRPPRICDPDGGLARNAIFLLGVYAAVMKESGLPLAFPGRAGAFRALFQCVEGNYLARACAWMATSPAARNRAFNVANGDLLRWVNLWQRLAAWCGMEAAEPAPLRLAQIMDSYAPAWSAVAARWELAAPPWPELVDWTYGDFIFAPEYDVFSETQALRLAGFSDAVDSEEMIFRHLDQFRARRLLP